MAARVLFALLTFQAVFGEQYRNSGFIDKLSTGMKFATDFLGSETVALKVAEFVVRAFQTANKPKQFPPNGAYSDANLNDHKDFSQEDGLGHDVNEISSPLAPLKHLVRLFGLQPNQISAVAVNALVFVAQMISTFFTGPRRPSRTYRAEDPASWIMNKNSKQLQELLAAAKNESLPDSIEDLIKNQGLEEETSCIRLFICKITPYINRMQKAVFGNETNNNFPKEMRGAAIMYRHLPNKEEIKAKCDICERRHNQCDLN